MDNAKSRAHEIYHKAQENAPINRRQALGLMTILVALGTITFIVGLTLTGTTIGFLFASPLLIIFSPILIPLAIVTFVAISSLLSFGGFVSFVVWVYRYYKGAHPVGSDQVDAARYHIAEGAKEVRDKTYAVAGNVQDFVAQKIDTSVAA